MGQSMNEALTLGDLSNRATREWGDCEFLISVDGVEVLRHHLSSETPSFPFLVDTPGRILTIEIDPGRYGPINDRVLIRRPLLLVEPDR